MKKFQFARALRLVPLLSAFAALLIGCAASSSMEVETPQPLNAEDFLANNISDLVIPFTYIVGDASRHFVDGDAALEAALQQKGYPDPFENSQERIRHLDEQQAKGFGDYVSGRRAAIAYTKANPHMSFLFVGTSADSRTVTWQTTRTTQQEIASLEDGYGNRIATYYQPVTRTTEHSRTTLEVFAVAWLYRNGKLLYERTVLDRDSAGGPKSWKALMTRLLDGMPSAEERESAEVQAYARELRRKEAQRQTLAEAAVVTRDMLPKDLADYYDGVVSGKYKADSWISIHESPKAGQYWVITMTITYKAGREFHDMRYLVLNAGEGRAVVERDDGPISIAFEIDLTKKPADGYNVTAAWVALKGGEPKPAQISTERVSAKSLAQSGVAEEFKGLSVGGGKWSGKHYVDGERNVWVATDGWFGGVIRTQYLDKNGKLALGEDGAFTRAQNMATELTSFGTDGKPWVKWR